jgi:nicotinate-nucleotide pyrophosphorylase (carboxylating)
MHLQELVRLALIEDVGPGDRTTEACVPADATSTARITAKAQLVVCGHTEAAEVFRQVGATYDAVVPEGTLVQPGTAVARLSGNSRALLTGERIALNFLMKLSGIATHTRSVVATAAGVRVVDTRKTSPLLRAQERRAVRIGGGANHRFALYDGILIKDNHIVAAGGITAAVRAAREHAHHLLRIEVEVEDAAQAAEAISAGADVLLLDNMTDAQMAAIISRHSGQCLFEASGNLTAERLAAFPGIGVQVASMGGLIHQSRWADLSMKFDAEPAR